MLNHIGGQIETFLRKTLLEVRPSWIVTIERKGTALLRTLVESPTPAVGWIGWDRVVSSKALPFAPDSYFESGDVLLLDDGVHSGHRIKEALDALVKRGVPYERIKIAVFGVHERAAFHPERRWFGQLSGRNYWDVRESVIRFFQRRGSLLLDTEHIEVAVEVNCGRLEFFDALCRAGTGIEYVSSGARHNLTIHNARILNQEEFVKNLPEGTLIDGVIRKIRVVQRERNLYTIIPIFYPSVPTDCRPSSMGGLYPCLRAIAAEGELNFQLVSIFASTKLFETTFACLRELINRGQVSVSVPTIENTTDAMSHLKAIFPQIDLQELHREVEKAVDFGRSSRLRKNEFSNITRLEAVEGSRYWQLLRGLYWQVLKGALKYSDETYFKKFEGASFAELIKSSEFPADMTLGQAERSALVGTAVDLAIDEAKLVSDVKSLVFSDGRNRLTRVLRLDGEIVLSDVRRATTMWRLPYPPPSEWSQIPLC